MKGKIWLRLSRSSPVIEVTALLLTLAAVITFPLVMARYTATANVQASGKVAKFQPVWTHVSGQNSGAGYVNPTGVKNIQWRLTNGSEVGIEGTLKMMITNKASGHRDKDSTPKNELGRNVGTYAYGLTLQETVNGVTTTGRVSIAAVPSAGSATVSKTPAADTIAPGANQVFTVQFTGAGAPAKATYYVAAPTGYSSTGNRNPTRANSATAGWRAYRVNFDATATQVN